MHINPFIIFLCLLTINVTLPLSYGVLCRVVYTTPGDVFQISNLLSPVMGEGRGEVGYSREGRMLWGGVCRMWQGVGAVEAGKNF
jgi:hypothetical protein